MNETGLMDLLKLFENDVTVADITASKLLGKISAAIAGKRMKLDMTQKEFAAYMNVSQGMVSRWEGGDYNFSIRALAEVAERLDLELSVNMSPCKNGVQLQRMNDADVSYITSNQKKFSGKTCKVTRYKSRDQITKDVSKCKFYSFNERLDM